MSTFDVTSIGDVIDGLVACFRRNLPDKVQVFDGIASDFPDVFVIVGGTVENVGEGDQTWASIGNSSMMEDYEIRCAVTAFVGGAAQESRVKDSANTQKRARDLAIGVYRDCAQALLDDKQLINYGAPLTGSGWVTISKVEALQTSWEDEESAKGRRLDLTFFVRVRNYLIALERSDLTLSWGEFDGLTSGEFDDLIWSELS